MVKRGFAIWLTGLPCSGKSTLAELLNAHFHEKGYPSQILDGDEIRQRLTKELDFSKKGREENIRRIAYVGKLITRVGGIALIAAISPYEKLRGEVRLEIGSYIEVYVECPLPICLQRDIKGHYAKAQKGEMLNFTGISDPYEPPSAPEIIVRTHEERPEESVSRILVWLIRHGHIPS